MNFTSYFVTLLNSCVNIVLNMNTSVLGNEPPRKAVTEHLVAFNGRLVLFQFKFKCFVAGCEKKIQQSKIVLSTIVLRVVSLTMQNGPTFVKIERSTVPPSEREKKRFVPI